MNKSTRFTFSLLSIIAVIVLVALPLAAQVDESAIHGTVTDAAPLDSA